MTILSARLLRGRKIRCNPRCVRRVCCGKDRQDCGRRAARSAAPIGAGLFRIASNSQPGQPSLVLSGVHATIAGVILGLVAPLRPKSPPEASAGHGFHCRATREGHPPRHPPLGVFPGSSLVCLGERRSGPIRGATESGDFESDCAGCISGSDTRKSVIESSYSLF